MKNRQIRIIAVLLATVLAYAGLIGAAAVTAQAADNAPVVQPVTAQTCVDIAVEAELSAADADNDVVLYQLTEKPRLGTAKIEGSTLYYTPGRKAGRDSFHYTAVDAEGNTAQPAAITIEIKKNKTGLTYSDMDGDPAHYAAIYLAQKGVMTGETIGSCAFFHPSRPVTRSEFIAMTAAAADLSEKFQLSQRIHAHHAAVIGGVFEFLGTDVVAHVGDFVGSDSRKLVDMELAGAHGVHHAAFGRMMRRSAGLVLALAD